MTLTTLNPPAMIHCLLRDVEAAWCVYSHSQFSDATQRDELLYYGLAKLRNVYDCPDAWRNSEWKKRINPSLVLSVSICAIGTRSECANARGKMMLQFRPICNAVGRDLGGLAMRITCNETGQSWATQSECCEALGINQGALSQHLARKSGFNTVKGLTFKRGE